MPEIGTPGLMSGDGKRGVGHRPQATAPILDFTEPTSDSKLLGTQRLKPRMGLVLNRLRMTDHLAMLAFRSEIICWSMSFMTRNTLF